MSPALRAGRPANRAITADEFREGQGGFPPLMCGAHGVKRLICIAIGLGLGFGFGLGSAAAQLRDAADDASPVDLDPAGETVTGAVGPGPEDSAVYRPQAPFVQIEIRRDLVGRPVFAADGQLIGQIYWAADNGSGVSIHLDDVLATAKKSLVLAEGELAEDANGRIVATLADADLRRLIGARAESDAATSTTDIP